MKILKVIIAIIVIIGAILLGIYVVTGKSPKEFVSSTVSSENNEIDELANKELTKDNIDSTIQEYEDKVGSDSDDVYYITYEYTRIGFSNLNSEDPFESVYGMTIKELIEKSKEDMQAQGTTVEEYKASLQNTTN